MIVFAVWTTWRLGQYLPAQPASIPAADASIAVMPFVNMSGDPTKEYFGDGVAEELLNDLANTPNLQVASRTSSFSFKGKKADIGEIARKLHVRAVVEGSARQQGRRIRIVAQLIDAKSGYHLWSASYDRDLGDILAVQDEIARAIVVALTQKLLPKRVSAIAYRAPPRTSINPNAYTAYLQGRYAENRSNSEEFLRAIASYKSAVKLQPDFAAAHAGLAAMYMALYVNGERRGILGSAKEEITTTLRLDPENFRALLADALLKGMERKWNAADSAMQNLLRRFPNNAEVHFNYAVFLEYFGLWEKILLELRRAVELEPLVPSYRDNLGGPLHFLGRDKEAVAEIKQVQTLDPNFLWAYADLCPLYAGMGKLNEAKQILRDRLMPHYSEDRETLYCAWIIANRQHDKRALQKFAHAAESLYARNALAASWIAYPHAMAGDNEEAMRWLEKAYDERDGNLFYVVVDPDFPAGVRHTARWHKFMQRPPFREIARVRAQILSRGG